MAMDWKAVGGLVASAAPTLGSLLGGLIPFPGGAVLGEVAGKILAEELGVPPTPDAVNTAITTGDPAAVQTKLSTAETRINAEVESHKADLADIQSARTTEVALVQAGSVIAFGPVIVSVLITLGFLAVFYLLLTLRLNFNDITGQVILLLTGSLSTMMTQVVNYWLGSSSGSADKSAQIAALAGIGSAPSRPASKSPAKK